MDKKTTGIVAYITWVGLLVAFLAGDKEGAKFHLNQALVLWVGCVIASIVTGVVGAIIPFLGGLLSMAVSVFSIVCMVLGIIAASKDEEKELPLIGQIKILS